jgi:glutathione synthase/RimK-type ligase-like ATP-grasp enzyme
MKLVLANNQTERFVAFHTDVQQAEKIYDYGDYAGLLFEFAADKVSFLHVDTGRRADEYDGVYLNGYLSTPEIAVTAATVLEGLQIHYVNSELGNAPSLSKLSAYAKLAARGVSIPRTFAGAARALRFGVERDLINIELPVVLKRADADRGIDNYILDSYDDVAAKLRDVEDRSLWVLQEFVPNEGFFVVSFYHSQPKFGIYRSLEARPDGRKELAHMYKPAGGINASLLDVKDIPRPVLDEAQRALDVMHREIGSADIVVHKTTGVPYVLEVNYNPQLVTITTFADIRREIFLDAMKEL